jgi:homoserine dehydrogenase
MIQNLYIIGANGNVGSNQVDQIFKRGDIDPSRHENPSRIVGVASICSKIYNPEGLARNLCYDFSQREDNDRRYDLSEILEQVQRRPPEGQVVFVDVTDAKEPMRDFHLDVIRNTDYCIATSNKNPVTMVSYDEFVELTKDVRRYAFSCSVMAGAGAVNQVRSWRDTNNPVLSIEGCFSGTLGYLCSELEKGRKFSEILKQAKGKYTEPDPRDDLNGLDVAKKILILARTAGHNKNIEDIALESFIPKEYLTDCSIEEFMAMTPQMDDYFAEKFNTAKKQGNAIRNIASFNLIADDAVLASGPKPVPKDNEFGRLSGTANLIKMVNDGGYDAEHPWIQIGPGAGLKVTAENIRSDLRNLLKETVVSYSK